MLCSSNNRAALPSQKCVTVATVEALVSVSLLMSCGGGRGGGTHHVDELCDGQSELDDDHVGDVGHGSGVLVVASKQLLEEGVLSVRVHLLATKNYRHTHFEYQPRPRQGQVQYETEASRKDVSCLLKPFQVRKGIEMRGSSQSPHASLSDHAHVASL